MKGDEPQDHYKDFEHYDHHEHYEQYGIPYYQNTKRNYCHFLTGYHDINMIVAVKV